MGVFIRKKGALVGVAALACAVAGCSAGGGSSSASCLAVMSFNGHVYVGTTLRTHAPYNKVGEIPQSHLHRLGKGTIPPCNDTNGSSGTARSVQVARISQVDPATAVAVAPGGDVYLRRGAAIPAILTKARWIRWIPVG